MKQDNTVSLSPFIGIWSSFMKINQRYDSIKPLYDAYSLDEVVNILTKGEGERVEAQSHSVETFFLRQQCSLLKKLLDAEKELTASLKERLVSTTIALHEEQARTLHDQYLAIKERKDNRTDELNELLKQWKAKLKRGEITSIEYQKAITPLKKELERLSFEAHHFLWENKKSFPEGVNIYDIMYYFDKKNKRGCPLFYCD